MSPKTSPSKPATAYLRLSVAADDSVSIGGQRALALAECERRGWPEPVFFVDEGVSGSKDIRRPRPRRAGEASQGWRVIDEAKAPVAREAIERVLAGESFRAVALGFNARGSRLLGEARRGAPTPSARSSPTPPSLG